MKRLICRLFRHRWVMVDVMDFYCSRCGRIVSEATLRASMRGER